ncbi:MAG: transporter substrate-binding domain-containing protein, partial [Firmicutes bacterium]|nr:transporter substrate-binding domain-containing protein [Bacillota bacterium]
MYKRLHYFLVIPVFLFLIVSIITNPVVASDDRTVYLSATEYDYPPFSVTDSGEADGFSVELLKAVAE